jgi:hypothetical protein
MRYFHCNLLKNFQRRHDNLIRAQRCWRRLCAPHENAVKIFLMMGAGRIEAGATWKSGLDADQMRFDVTK